MTSKFNQESVETLSSYGVDKSGKLVALAEKVNQSSQSSWPKTPNGMPWCESC